MPAPVASWPRGERFQTEVKEAESGAKKGTDANSFQLYRDRAKSSAFTQRLMKWSKWMGREAWSQRAGCGWL